jgi:hypothetical protein
MANFLDGLRKLCNPAFVYLALSVAAVLFIAFQNLGNTKTYCVGLFECEVSNTLVVFLFKAIYILFWTFILNVLCKGGYKNIAWFLVLLPFILFFILIGWFLLNNGAQMVSK